MGDILNAFNNNFNSAIFWDYLNQGTPLILSFFSIGFVYRILKNLLVGGSRLKFNL